MAALPIHSPQSSHLENLYHTSMDRSPLTSQLSPNPYRRNDSIHSQHRVGGEPGASTSYENGVVGHSLTPSSDLATELSQTLDEDFPDPICGGCKKLIDEDSADAGVIHFA